MCLGETGLNLKGLCVPDMDHIRKQIMEGRRGVELNAHISFVFCHLWNAQCVLGMSRFCLG